MNTTPRAMRTTDNILNDLEQLVITANDEIAYLAGTYPNYEGELGAKFKGKHDRLVRARDWLRRKIDSEKAKREGLDG